MASRGPATLIPAALERVHGSHGQDAGEFGTVSDQHAGVERREAVVDLELLAAGSDGVVVAHDLDQGLGAGAGRTNGVESYSPAA
jgi:hypothetical protein